MQLESNNEEPFRFLSEHFIIFENARDFVQIDDQKGWRMLLFCIEGCFQIEVNGTPYTIEPNDIAFCTPDKMVTRTMISRDICSDVRQPFPNGSFRTRRICGTRCSI